MKPNKPIVFGELTARQAEDLYRFGTVNTLIMPDPPEADFDLPGYPPADKQRLNDIANRWRRAYVGNFLRVDTAKFDYSDHLVYEAGDHVITTDHVHTSEMQSIDDITEFVINSPEDVKWLLQLVLDLVEPDEGDSAEVEGGNDAQA